MDKFHGDGNGGTDSTVDDTDNAEMTDPTESSVDENSDSQSTLTDENYPWQHLTADIVENFQSLIDSRRERYEKDGFNETDALCEAYQDLEERMLRKMQELVFEAMQQNYSIDNDKTFQAIEASKAKIKGRDEVQGNKALKFAIDKKKHLLRQYLPEQKDFDQESDEDGIAESS